MHWWWQSKEGASNQLCHSCLISWKQDLPSLLTTVNYWGKYPHHRNKNPRLEGTPRIIRSNLSWATAACPAQSWNSQPWGIRPSLGRLFQWLLVLPEKNFPLVCHQNVPRSNLCPSPLVLSVWLLGKRGMDCLGWCFLEDTWVLEMHHPKPVEWFHRIPG